MTFLDTNVLLEIILADRPHCARVKRFLESIKDETAVSMLTVHLVMHFGRKQQTEDAFLHAVLAENTLLALTPEDYRWAADNEQGVDFEDALQVAVAVRSGCKTFVTLDAALAKRYASSPLTIATPK